MTLQSFSDTEETLEMNDLRRNQATCINNSRKNVQLLSYQIRSSLGIIALPEQVPFPLPKYPAQIMFELICLLGQSVSEIHFSVVNTFIGKYCNLFGTFP
jgi:hypothetical protein